jgi:hypothetical protein
VSTAAVDLVCTVDKHAQADRDCSTVPSLSEGVLTLNADGSFDLRGRYEACYQVEDINLSGTYLADAHENGVDLELNATKQQSNGERAHKLSRTIGLVNLDTQSLKARFTDTAAVIRSRGQLPTVAPNVEMICVGR